MCISKINMRFKFRNFSNVAVAIFCLFSNSSSAFSPNMKKGDTGGKNYYVSMWGNDNNSGLDEFKPWRTLEKISDTEFFPGDIIKLRGGDTFEGNLIFKDEDGTDDEPITITSYGSGQATITPRGFNGSGITIIGRGGFKIENLKITGDYNTDNFKSKDSLAKGIYIYNFQTKRKCSKIQLENLTISNFKSEGINIGGDKTPSNGYTSISVKNCTIGNCGDIGIKLWGLRYQNILISGNTIFNIKGFRPQVHGFSGNGISLSHINGAIVERNLIFNCGKYAQRSGGGIVTGTAKSILVRYNEIYGIKSNDIDGDAIDFDVGSDSCIAEYNYTHNNSGSGFLISGNDNKKSGSDYNIIRYNISKNDGLKNNYPAIYLYSKGSVGNQIYNNTIVTTSFGNNIPKCISISGKNSNTLVTNNIFYTINSAILAKIDNSTRTNLNFSSNSYYSHSGDFIVSWKNIIYEDYDYFIRFAGPEINAAGNINYNTDPMMKYPLIKTDTINNAFKIDTLSAYKLLPQSTLINNGINPDSFRNPPAMDFYGTELPVFGRVDIGAYEHR